VSAERAKREAHEAASRAKGWLTDAEGSLLFDLARACTGAGAILEIGSWQGRSTIWLARGSAAANRVPVYAVDPHTGSPEHHERYGEVWTFDIFRENIAAAGVSDLVHPILAPSVEAARGFDRPLELLFIDGDHSYEAVREDFDAWVGRVVEGGFVALHDTGENWDGPRRVVRESLFGSRHFTDIGFADSITYARRRTVGPLVYTRNRFIATGRDAAQALSLPDPLRRLGRRVLGYNRR
jgi:predicted O-methyltransferase YrrM